MHFGRHFGRHFGWHFGGYVPPVGPPIADAFVILIEAGARVTYEWGTDVLPAASGYEQRSSRLALPRIRYEFASYLTDSQQRALIGQLWTAAPAASAFGLGLAYESTEVAGTSGPSISLHGPNHDWLTQGQRVIVFHPDSVTSVQGVIQTVSGASFTMFQSGAFTMRRGDMVMPMVSTWLDANQVIDRHPVHRSAWRIQARDSRFRFGTAGTAGVGASVTTYDGMPMWDWGIGVDTTAAQGIASGVRPVDRGASTSQIAGFDVAKGPRPIEFASSKRSEWQWLKKFLYTVNGRRTAFLLPTGRPDLVAVGDAPSGALIVTANYEATWWPSAAHRRLRIVLDDESVHYRTVESAAVNVLTLNEPLTGAIERIEFLETVRLDHDEISIEWQGRACSTSLRAMVVQA